ncbi:MAG: hypothetical protein WCV80_00490 [Candidatus Paceibacterota bacterium]|jgi:transcriptional regulator of heat shock response
MKDRTRSILEAAVMDFIKHGKPITSEYLYEIHDFGIKPAMIRWELNDLSETGFFYQTHPSGGRFPTDKAYRFFAEEALNHSEEDVPNIFSALEDSMENDIKSFVSKMADYLQLLSVGYNAEKHSLYGSGLKELLAHLDLDSTRELVDVVNDFESLEESLLKKRDWWESGTVWPRVFVGQSPVTRSECLSVVAGKVQCEGGEVVVLSIGPKRMDYQKSVKLFKALGTSKTKKTKKKANHE